MYWLVRVPTIWCDSARLLLLRLRCEQLVSLREPGSRWGNFVVGLSAKAAARLPHSTVHWR